MHGIRPGSTPGLDTSDLDVERQKIQDSKLNLCAQCSVSQDAAQIHSQIRVSMVTWSRLYTGVLTGCLSEGKC